MATVTLNINGRTYDLACEDGQEAHLLRLGELVETRVKQLADNVGQVGESRLLLMAALMVADELTEASKGGSSPAGNAAGAAMAGGEAERFAAETMEKLAQRIERIAARLEDA